MDDLTYREKQVLKHLLQGCTNKEIAGRIFVSEITVKKHLQEICIKTGCSNRVKLALYAERNSFLSLINQGV